MTTHPDSITTLPGTLPGLLRRGAPVFAPADADRTPGVFIQAVMGGARCHVAWLGPRRSEIAPVTCPTWRDLALDLTDPAGRDVAARWLAERHGLAVGTTAPAWEWAIVDGRDVWTLDGRIVIDRTSGQNATEALALACLSLASI